MEVLCELFYLVWLILQYMFNVMLSFSFSEAHNIYSDGCLYLKHVDGMIQSIHKEVKADVLKSNCFLVGVLGIYHIHPVKEVDFSPPLSKKY